jgi:hypothetical protein
VLRKNLKELADLFNSIFLTLLAGSVLSFWHSGKREILVVKLFWAQCIYHVLSPKLGNDLSPKPYFLICESSQCY